MDPEVFNDCKAWCRSRNGHSRTEANLGVQALQDYIETKHHMKIGRTACTDYMHKFGGRWEGVKKHHFVDNHEKPEVIAQEAAFLDEYKRHPLVLSAAALVLALALALVLYPRPHPRPRPLISTLYLAPSSRPRASRSPLDLVPRARPSSSCLACNPLTCRLYLLGANFVADNDKDMCEDVLAWRNEELKHARGFGFRGSLHSQRDPNEPIVVIAADDEVCVFASEGELFCWRFEGMPKGATPAKNKGSCRHVAGVATEAGNGRISMDHGGAEGSPAPNGGMIEMSDMKAYIKAKHAGDNPIIPRHADVTMKPGKNDEGWWAGVGKSVHCAVCVV